jgi:chemotaxis protein histidine kinase CheA
VSSQPTRGEADDDIGRFERLNQAAAALLDPLIDPELASQPTQQARRLAEALGACAQAADRAGVRGLNHLATLAVPHLPALAVRADWPAQRDALEGWVGLIVAYSAGHLVGEDVEPLLGSLLGLPGLPAVPAQFVTLIRRRLTQDAQRIAALASMDPAGGGIEARAPGAPGASVITGRPAVDVDADRGRDQPVAAGRVAEPLRVAPELPSEPIAVARDELDMLAQAMQALADECTVFAETAAGAAIAELASGLPMPPAPGQGDWLEAVGERLRHWLNAAGYIGLVPLVELVGGAADSVASWQRAGAAADAREAGVAAVAGEAGEAREAGASARVAGDRRASLIRFAQALAAFLLEPGEVLARSLCEALAQGHWPVRLDPAAVDPAVAAITRLRIVASRRVQAHAGAIDEDDLSLVLPIDADPGIVDQLLGELPALSAALSSAIDANARGATAALADAQRIAHTLKGAAHTVGIRGIATLAHLLEDLLALLADRDDAPPPSLLGLVEEAADGLSAMCEALTGQGPAPADALGLCRRVADQVAALLDGRPADTGTTRAGASEPSDPAEATPGPSVEAGEPDRDGAVEPLRDEPRVLDRMLELAAEASLLLAQAQEQLARLQETRASLRVESERLQELAGELDRVVDLRSAEVGRDAVQPGFDALELERYDDLHTVSRRIAEAGADGRLIDRQLDQHVAGLGDAFSQLERVQEELREHAMRARMIPVSTIVPRLQRAVRQASRMAGRRAQLEVSGGGTLVDARLLQALVDPLVHVLRNAVDHGIEDEAQRVASGKPPVGVIRVRFEHTGHEFRIACDDDGRGLDEAAIRWRASAAQLLDHDASPLAPAQLARLVMRPGFTTRAQPTQLSGRGLGMDIVRRAVEGLRGSVLLRSEPGQGLGVDFRVPIELAGVPVLVARTPTHVLALSVRQVSRVLPAAGLVTPVAETEAVVEGPEGPIPLRRLDALLGLPPGWFRHPDPELPDADAGPPLPEVVVVVRASDGSSVALVTPELSATRRVVLRPLPPWLARMPGVEGTCVLGDGSAAAVLDLPQLMASGGYAAGGWALREDEGIPATRAALPRCLVVDDSVSVRRATEAFLRDLGCEVEGAGDGLEALARLRRRVPDLALIDLEMPRMNGVELVRAMRADPALHRVPVIMITSRASAKHRRVALDAGVDVFLTKPYGEDELAGEVRRCLEARAPLG